MLFVTPSREMRVSFSNFLTYFITSCSWCKLCSFFCFRKCHHFCWCPGEVKKSVWQRYCCLRFPGPPAAKEKPRAKTYEKRKKGNNNNKTQKKICYESSCFDTNTKYWSPFTESQLNYDANLMTVFFTDIRGCWPMLNRSQWRQGRPLVKK